MIQSFVRQCYCGNVIKFQMIGGIATNFHGGTPSWVWERIDGSGLRARLQIRPAGKRIICRLCYKRLHKRTFKEIGA